MNLNIVIDLDGVITNVDFTKFIRKSNIVLEWDQLDLSEQLILKKLFSFGIALYSKHAIVRDNASKVINELKTGGDNISILTRRMFTLDNDANSERIKKIVELHLLENNIPYNQLIHTTGDKIAECTNLKADVVVEDNPANITALANAGFTLICFRTPYNQNIKENGKNIFVAHNWEEVYNRIELIRKIKEQSPLMLKRSKDEKN